MSKKTRIVFGGSRKDDHYKKFVKFGIITVIMAILTFLFSVSESEIAILCFVGGAISAVISFYNFIMYRYTKKNS